MIARSLITALLFILVSFTQVRAGCEPVCDAGQRQSCCCETFETRSDVAPCTNCTDSCRTADNESPALPGTSGGVLGDLVANQMEPEPWFRHLDLDVDIETVDRRIPLHLASNKLYLRNRALLI